MSNRLHAVTLAALASVFAISGIRAAESPYYKNVSDIEVETAVKGTTYDKGPVNYFSGGGSSKKSDCCCVCPAPVAAATTTTAAPTAAVQTTPAPTTSTPAAVSTPQVKYILDGKPVYEEGTAPAPDKKSTSMNTNAEQSALAEVVTVGAKGISYEKGPVGAPSKHTDCGCCSAAPIEAVTAPAPDKAQAAVMKNICPELQYSISQLATSSWHDAQTHLVESGKPAIPCLINALNISDSAYNLGGHTKSDSGRLPRQRTIADVCAELLSDIVVNHSSYQGELPAANQDAWRAWWSQNADSVTFASN